MQRTFVGILLALSLAACSQAPTPAQEVSASTPERASGNVVLKPLDTVLVKDSNGVVVPGNVTKTPGEVSSVRLFITVNDNETDTVNGCNANANNPVTITLESDNPNVVVNSPASVTVSTCDTVHGTASYTVKSTATDGQTANLTAKASGGRQSGSGSFIPGSFKVTVTVPKPTDTTPPVITPTITGTQGDNGWYTSNATLTWSVTDAESKATSSNCDSS